MGHEPKMKHDKPMMGHEPKMDHKPKKMVDISKVGKGQQNMIESIVEKARGKMATPKMVDDKNFPKMAQDMAKALIPPMDGAKMYKPTKYHDMPKMGHEPKMGHKPKMGHEPKMGHKPKAYHDKK